MSSGVIWKLAVWRKSPYWPWVKVGLRVEWRFPGVLNTFDPTSAEQQASPLLYVVWRWSLLWTCAARKMWRPTNWIGIVLVGGGKTAELTPAGLPDTLSSNSMRSR